MFSARELIHFPGPMDTIIERSRAIDSFKSDVRRFRQGLETERIRIDGYAPRVKVERVLAQLLAAEGELPIERVEISGRSGCSDFIGTVAIETPTERRVVDFVWCCRWRAEQEGWTDYFGFPDQMRAAREFGWQCFERWNVREVGPLARESAGEAELVEA
jgi:hypothetical protein